MNSELLKLPEHWAILPSELEKIKIRAATVKKEELKTFFDNPNETRFQGFSFFMNGAIAVMSISGVLSPKLTFWSWLFGGTGLDVLSRDFKLLVDDPKVEAIILDIDSPGGSVHCIQEFAAMVFESRDSKPIVAASSITMASAAYWIGAAAEAVFITDEAVVTGSIGVITTHIDISEMLKMEGIKVTEIVAGDKKNIGSPNMPLSKEAEAEIQKRVDFIEGNFISDIAKFRGVSVETVRKDMAEGQIFIGSQAVKAGLVDEVLDSQGILNRVNAEIGNSAENGGNFIRGESMSLFKKGEKGGKAEGEEQILTADMVHTDHKAVFDEIFAMGKESIKAMGNENDGYKKGYEEGKQESWEAGARAERERIQAVRAQSMPGHEALIEKFVEDGKTTGPEAAVAVLQAEKANKTAGLNTLHNEATPPIDLGTAPADEENTNTEKTAQERWDASAELREEFHDNFGAFEAYEKNVAAGRVRRLNKSSVPEGKAENKV